MEQLRWLDTRSEATMKQIGKLARRFLEGDADSTRDLRQAVVGRASALAGGAPASVAETPEDWRPYVDKVALYAYKVLDQDVEALKGAGHSEEEIFEVTLGAGLGASLGRLESAFGLLDREKS